MATGCIYVGQVTDVKVVVRENKIGDAEIRRILLFKTDDPGVLLGANGTEYSVIGEGIDGIKGKDKIWIPSENQKNVVIAHSVRQADVDDYIDSEQFYTLYNERMPQTLLWKMDEKHYADINVEGRVISTVKTAQEYLTSSNPNKTFDFLVKPATIFDIQKHINFKKTLTFDPRQYKIPNNSNK